MTSPDQPAEAQFSPATASPQFPSAVTPGDIPNVNLGTPEGTLVEGPGQPDEPARTTLDASSSDFYDNMTGIVRVQYIGEEPLTLGTLRFGKGDVIETSNANVKGLLSGDNGSNFQRV